jgi:1,2-diacylglycerol 3-beta-glucosyltransferase
MSSVVLIAAVIVVIAGMNVLYLFIFSIAACFPEKPGKDLYIPDREAINTLVLFPVYKEDEIILQSVKNFMQQKYPPAFFKVVVIADDIKDESIALIRGLGAGVCRLPLSDKRNKARAINYLLDQLHEQFDNCIIMDADNLVGPDFLARVNKYFSLGDKVIQARRVAKNSGNNLSLLDTYSEIINNHIFRKGQQALGLSSSLIGSGMVFDFNLFKEVMHDLDVYSGFDKELELRLLERKIKIKYGEDIVVYDEKVDNRQAFINQRRRWIYAQLYFLRANFFKAVYLFVLKGNYDYANKVLQFMLLPRILLIGLCFILLIATPFINMSLFFAAISVCVLLCIALFIPLRQQVLSADGLAALPGLPGAFAGMLLATMTSGRAAKKFLHTPHNTKNNADRN